MPGYRMRLRTLLAEPMLHFIVMGIVLFAVHRLVAPVGSDGNRIVVTQGIVADLAAQHEARWGRSPTRPELTSLVESYVRDEILYREGVTLGLDRDDPVVKRRVCQKLEVMAEEGTSAGAPSDAELSAYLAANAARFTRPAILTFEQVFLGPSAAGASVERVSLRQDLGRRGFDPTALRKPSLLPSQMTSTPTDLIARDFGAKFATALERVPVGEWAGPIDSAFGAHVVRVLERTPAMLPPLSDIRDAVVREWENERRQRARNDSYRKLRSTYDVDIEATLTGVTP